MFKTTLFLSQFFSLNVITTRLILHVDLVGKVIIKLYLLWETLTCVELHDKIILCLRTTICDSSYLFKSMFSVS